MIFDIMTLILYSTWQNWQTFIRPFHLQEQYTLISIYREVSDSQMKEDDLLKVTRQNNKSNIILVKHFLKI